MNIGPTCLEDTTLLGPKSQNATNLHYGVASGAPLESMQRLQEDLEPGTLVMTQYRISQAQDLEEATDETRESREICDGHDEVRTNLGLVEK
jgi:hypothetical protein